MESSKTSSNISLKKIIKRKGSSSSDASITTTNNSIDYSSNPILLVDSLDPEKLSKIEYETVNNRRYMKVNNNRFFLPCDDEEADRLVILHFLLKYAFNGNTISPILQSFRKRSEDNKKDRPQVLDIGCGPGTWVLEMATEFPNTEFHGIDLRTMFPTSIKPTNTHFVQHDFLDTLPYPDESFDFVKMRLMLGTITPPQLTKLLSEIQRVLKPLGYVEFLDVDQQIHRPGPLCDSMFNKKCK
ncbi:S-adenosyl-L-methionine-dependent methyltransferase [Pilobolus umbonatus]|nr:S-adenosyl-L-methionine-dependent methyltransferase [Pilobolus umbonatus]